jgi:predicted lipoprotein with Yx(FWY)xxD motif
MPQPKLTRPRRLLAVPFAAATIGLVAAACASSSHTAPSPAANTSTGPYPTASSPAAQAPTSSAAAALTVARTSLGTILADGQGRTLYLFEKDMGTNSSCSGACAVAWPPATTADRQPAVAGAADQSLVGTTTRPDGTVQLTYAGHPLYRFAGDNQPGDTNGQGSQAFGAGWDVLSPAGQKIEANGS